MGKTVPGGLYVDQQGRYVDANGVQIPKVTQALADAYFAASGQQLKVKRVRPRPKQESEKDK